MKTTYTITIDFPVAGTHAATRRTLYFGSIKAREAVIEMARAQGYKFSTNIEHVYTEAEGIKSFEIEERFAAMHMERIAAA